MPGSFADLIAATSTEKKVFDVSAAEVTSSLFGTRESQRSPIKSSGSSSPHKPNHGLDPLDILGPTSPIDTVSKGLTSAAKPVQDSHPPRANSPEPPKLSPPKRVINPVFKPQNKEKLIFASAPYVSPISVSNQSRPNNLYPWQSPAPHQSSPLPNQRTNSTQSSISVPKFQPPIPPIAKPQQHTGDHPFAHKGGLEAGRESRSSSFDEKTSGNSAGYAAQPTKTAPNEYKIKPSVTETSLKNETACESSMDETAKSLHIDSSVNDSYIATNSLVAHYQSAPSSKSAPKQVEQPPEKPDDAPVEPVGQKKNEPPAVPSAGEDKQAKKSAKPRGPPKKSKEARQAIVMSPPRPVVATPQRYLITQGSGLPVIPGPSNATMIVAAQPSVVSAATNGAKEKPKAKRAKKQKDTSNGQASLPAGPNVTQHVIPKPPLICGLVAPPVGAQAGTAHVAAKGSQQFLISRPLLLNTMPQLSATQLQQLPRAAGLPMMPTTIQNPLSLAATQPGTRIVWATQPRPQGAMGTAVVNSAPRLPTVAAPTSLSAARTTKPKSNQAQLPKAPTSSSRQPDNAALLSLATTALSTAPLPTTPTLSYLGGLRPPTGQAIMVSSATGQPALLTGQPFFNSFLPRLPIPGPYPPLGVPPIGATGPGIGARPIISATDPRPTGQLVFARLPNQGQPRYLITQPYIQPGPQIPQMAPGQAGHPMIFNAFSRPSCPQSSTKDGMKAKKVKTR